MINPKLIPKYICNLLYKNIFKKKSKFCRTLIGKSNFMLNQILIEKKKKMLFFII